MGNQGRDSQTDEVLWISRREVARRGPQAGAPLGSSRTLPTLKRVVLSPTSGPQSGILDRRFGQKADMAPSNLLFSLMGLQQGQSCLTMITTFSSFFPPSLTFEKRLALPTARPAIWLISRERAAHSMQHLMPRSCFAHNFQVMGARRAE